VIRLPSSMLLPSRAFCCLLVVAALGLAAEEVRIGALRARVAELSGQIQSERAAAAQAMATQTEAFRAEESRRHAAIQEITHVHQVQIARLRADAARSADAARGLRARLSELSAQRLRDAAGYSAATDGRPPADSAAGVLPELLGQCVDRVRVLAEFADAAHAAGQQCQQSWGALIHGQ
jgi:hypothetical protein